MKQSTQVTSHGITILSLDGGRFESQSALSQFFHLDEIVRIYEYDNELPEASVKVHELFDLIVGTGSGGLVAMLVGPLRLKIEDAISKYTWIHQTVFNPSPDTTSPETRSRILAHALEKTIHECLGDEWTTRRMSEIEQFIQGCRVTITAMNEEDQMHPTCFRSFRTRSRAAPGCTLSDAGLATLSNPDSFPSVSIGTPSERFISTTFGPCNAMDGTITEAISNFPNQTIALILSIGAGCEKPDTLNNPPDVVQTAAELSQRYPPSSEHWERQFGHFPSLYARFDVEGLDLSTDVSYGKIRAKCNAYLARSAIQRKAEEVVRRLINRPLTLPISCMSWDEAGVMEVVLDEVARVDGESGSLPHYQEMTEITAVNHFPPANQAPPNSTFTFHSGTRETMVRELWNWAFAQRKDNDKADRAYLYSLSTLAVQFRRNEEASKAIEDVMAVLRRIAKRYNTLSTDDLASRLDDLSGDRFYTSHKQEALALIEGSVALRRLLTTENPTFHTEGLAKSLFDLSTRLSALGLHQEALEAIEESVVLLRPLAAKNPSPYTHALADYLFNFSLLLSGLGQHQAGLKAIEECVALRRPLAAGTPEDYAGLLANTLYSLSLHLTGLGRYQEALEANEECVALLRLRTTRTVVNGTDILAGSLCGLCLLLSSLDRQQEALKAAKECVALWNLHPIGAGAPCANSVEALKLIEECVTFHRSLSRESPALRISSLCNHLRNRPSGIFH